MSSYTNKDLKEDTKSAEEKKYNEDIAKWLHSRPEVGMLNSGKFYIHAGPDRIYTEIEAFSK